MTEKQSTARWVVIEPAARAGLVMVFFPVGDAVRRQVTADCVLDDALKQDLSRETSRAKLAYFLNELDRV
jgi:hypothetical protein